jgi:hypothetical protein
LEALLARDRLPEASPLVRGVNLTVSEALWPVVRVIGNETPLTENSGLLRLAPEMVTLDPDACNVATRFLLVPTTTLPKLKLPGTMLNRPAAPPVADNGMLGIALEASDVNEMLPLALPPVLGLKVTSKVKLLPLSNLRGSCNPPKLNAVPDTAA